MRIDLANDQWIEIRESVKGGDIFAVNEAAEVPLDDEGRATRMSFKKLDDDQFIALAARVVTGWSFQVPVPGVQFPDPGQALKAMRSVLSDLDGRDLRKFRTAMQPLLDLVKGDGDLPEPKSGDVPAGPVPA